MSHSSEKTAAVTTIVIADDHELSRIGLNHALQDHPAFQVLGAAENGYDAAQLAIRLKPDVVLMDIEMPQMNGITATQLIKEQAPEVKVIMLTSRQHGDEVYAALAAGADAYCLKDIRIERLVQVMEMVMEGAIWLDPAIARMVMNALPKKNGTLQAHGGLSRNSYRKSYNVDLTERELEVLALIVEGKSNKEIATSLFITTNTVKTHVCGIIQKLSVDDRTQAAVKALQEGILDNKKSNLCGTGKQPQGQG